MLICHLHTFSGEFFVQNFVHFKVYVSLWLSYWSALCISHACILLLVSSWTCSPVQLCPCCPTSLYLYHPEFRAQELSHQPSMHARLRKLGRNCSWQLVASLKAQRQKSSARLRPFPFYVTWTPSRPVPMCLLRSCAWMCSPLPPQSWLTDIFPAMPRSSYVLRHKDL